MPGFPHRSIKRKKEVENDFLGLGTEEVAMMVHKRAPGDS